MQKNRNVEYNWLRYKKSNVHENVYWIFIVKLFDFNVKHEFIH